jgi:DNA-binding PadR family transcriptional regulator
MFINNALSAKAREAMGPYIPVHPKIAEKIGWRDTAVMQYIFQRMHKPDAYELIPTCHFHKTVFTTRDTLPPILRNLQRRGLVNIMEGKGGRHASKRYRVDIDQWAALHDMTREEFLAERLREIRNQVTDNPQHVTEKPQRIKEKDLEVVRKKEIDRDIENDVEEELLDLPPASRRAKVWKTAVERHLPEFVEELMECARKHTTKDLDEQTVQYSAYFILEEQWQFRSGWASGRPLSKSSFLQDMLPFIAKRWGNTWRCMFAYDLLAARIYDACGLRRKIVKTKYQLPDAEKFAKLYNALIATAESPQYPEPRIRTYLQFVCECIDKYDGFEFPWCVDARRLREFDDLYPPVTGKQSVSGYLNTL